MESKKTKEFVSTAGTEPRWITALDLSNTFHLGSVILGYSVERLDDIRWVNHESRRVCATDFEMKECC